jgi:hypothetical protein
LGGGTGTSLFTGGAITGFNKLSFEKANYCFSVKDSFSKAFGKLDY